MSVDRVIGHLRTMNRVMAALNSCKSYILRATQSTDINNITARYKKMDVHFGVFNEAIQDIYINVPQVEDAVPDLDKRIEDFETLFYDVVATYESELRCRNRGHEPINQLEKGFQALLKQQSSFMEGIAAAHEFLNRTINNQQKDINLSNNNINSFGGNHCDWKAFHDRYLSTIHNHASLSDSNKLKYLKSLLKNRAATLLKHITISTTNYNETWNKLVEHYNNPQSVVTSYIRSIKPGTNTGFGSSVDFSVKGICCLCCGKHYIYQCRKFNEMNIIERHYFVNTKSLCCNCLAAGHNAQHCRSKRNCRICNRRHHSLIHHQQSQISHKSALNPHAAHFNSITATVNKTTINKSAFNNLIFGESSFNNSSFNNSLFNESQSNYSSVNSTMNKLTTFNKARTFDESAIKATSSVTSHNNGQGTFDASANIATSSVISVNKAQGIFDASAHMATSRVISHNKTSGTFDASAHKATSSVTSYSKVLRTFDASAYMATSSVTSYNIVPRIFDASAPMATSSVTSLVAKDNQLNSLTVLSTASFLSYDASGTPQQCRALLDSESSATAGTESLVQLLSLHCSHSKISKGELASYEAGTTKGKVRCTISSGFSSQSELVVNAFLSNRITAVVPSSFISLKNQSMQFAKSIEFVHSSFIEPLPIDHMIIGADYVFSVITCQQIINVKSNANITFAEHTISGWVMYGTVETFKHEVKQCAQLVIGIHATKGFDRKLKGFLEINHIPNQTYEEEKPKYTFINTHSISSEGEISVLIPFKGEANQMSIPINSAISTLKQMERGFERKTRLNNINNFYLYNLINCQSHNANIFVFLSNSRYYVKVLSTVSSTIWLVKFHRKEGIGDHQPSHFIIELAIYAYEQNLGDSKLVACTDGSYSSRTTPHLKVHKQHGKQRHTTKLILS